MKTVFRAFKAGETINVRPYLKNPKLAKYFSRETEAAVAAAGELLKATSVPPKTPFYYAIGLIEYEDYGLPELARLSTEGSHSFDDRRFIKNAIPIISPLTQFKVLYNMPLCFIAIEYGLHGDNAVVYHNAAALITQALYGSRSEQVLLGAGRVYKDGSAESAFVLAAKKELAVLTMVKSELPAIELLKNIHQAGGAV